MSETPEKKFVGALREVLGQDDIIEKLETLLVNS